MVGRGKARLDHYPCVPSGPVLCLGTYRPRSCYTAQTAPAIRAAPQVMVNEEMDPSLVIRRLKQEIRDLREEIKVLQGAEEERGPLTPDEIVRLQQQVRSCMAYAQGG